MSFNIFLLQFKIALALICQVALSLVEYYEIDNSHLSNKITTAHQTLLQMPSSDTSLTVAGSFYDAIKLDFADGLDVSGNYVYVTSHQLTRTAYFNVIDISDPTALSPSDMVSLGRPEFIGGDQPYITGRYAYVPATSSGPATGSLSAL